MEQGDRDQGRNIAPSAAAVQGIAGPKPLPLLPKLSLFSHKEDGWEHSQKHAK